MDVLVSEERMNGVDTGDRILKACGSVLETPVHSCSLHLAFDKQQFCLFFFLLLHLPSTTPTLTHTYRHTPPHKPQTHAQLHRDLTIDSRQGTHTHNNTVILVHTAQ